MQEISFMAVPIILAVNTFEIFKTKINKSLSKTKAGTGVPAFFVARFAATSFILFPMGEKEG